MKKAKVYLVSCGSYEYGDPTGIVSIHATKEGAERAKREYERPIERGDGTTYTEEVEIEELDLQE